MVLERVPAILQQLRLTPEQIAQINAIRDSERGNRRFVGQIAVDERIVTQEQLNAALLAQVVNKGVAAERDLQTIAHNGAQGHARWLEANWGNRGVNRATDQPSVTAAGTASIANTAQNIVMLVNDNNPQLAGNQDVQAGVRAAARLTRFIAGTSDEGLSAEQARELRNAAMAGLRRGARGVELRDTQNPPQPINLDDFIRERQTEIDRGINERIRLQGLQQGSRQSLVPSSPRGNGQASPSEQIGR